LVCQGLLPVNSKTLAILITKEAEMATTRLTLILFVSFAVIVPSLRAHIAEFDTFWQHKSEEAKKDALKAYQPNPEEITEQLNSRVNE
jgi:pectate lyase